jgi:hypothetical protein
MAQFRKPFKFKLIDKAKVPKRAAARPASHPRGSPVDPVLKELQGTHGKAAMVKIEPLKGEMGRVNQLFIRIARNR